MHTPRTIITFKPANIRFTFRVGGILIHREHVLCQLSSQEDFWFLPGGRAELGESASVTLLREMQEELGVDVKIERLLYVVENFFTDPDDSWHELGMYFLITAPADSYLYQSLETIKRVDEVGNHLRFDWLPIAQLEELPLYPSCFQKALQEIPEHTVHIEEYDSPLIKKQYHMSKQHISSGSPYEPRLGISRAVRAGHIIAVAGTAPIGPDGKTAGKDDAAAQARRCIEIIGDALKQAGASLSDVMRTRILLTHIEDWESVGLVHGEFFGNIRPANTVMQVTRFIDPDWLVEIEADAVVEEKD